ncbi:alcohol dehydrogenase catalytic domain-containing protein [Nocardia sp. ET3-3]|uniref:Alcohol dehydrogenase catalytic domain-containing protein n=1 Tax=Nocardia terrae TaxID=2675851 RepID=A0A7K1V2D5_9NOCA|nr:alcohol dehydrogenase catalytic domain-containing protein [Nocardia terrae]MVU80652.1 alcohol dehydrogenase catalytic domain-containing protein [Nocardia terrae]
MKAATLIAPERISVIDVPDPTCGPREVLVRMRGVGLCGSDLSVYRGHRAVPDLPWILGHEGVGDIVAVGAEVDDQRIGEQVAIEPNYCCLQCEPCRAGFTSACPNRIILGINAPGVLAEFVAVPADFAFPVAPHVELADLVCAEPLTVARAAIRRSGITAGDSCLVVGTGSQGLFLCELLVDAGVKPHVIEPHEGRRILAETLGATAAAESDSGFRFLFETSGVAAALPPALARLAPGGTAMLIGINAEPLGVSSFDIVYRQLRLLGSLIYDHPTDFADTAALLDGGLSPSRVLQAEFPLAEAARAFEAVRTTPGKCWIRLD